MKSLLFLVIVYWVNFNSLQGSPVPSGIGDNHDNLPSITYDTLVGYFDPKYSHGHSILPVEMDSDMAESVPGPISGPIMGYTAYRLVRGMLSDDPTSLISYYSPFRVAARVANGMSNVGKTFMSTFASEFQKSYDALSTGIKARMGGVEGVDQESAGSGSQPHRASFTESEWMEGI